MVPHLVPPALRPLRYLQKRMRYQPEAILRCPTNVMRLRGLRPFHILDLLKFNSNLIRKLLLGHPNQPSAMSNAFSTC